MPNNQKPPTPPFTFSRNELPSGDEGERLDRILRRIQLAFNSIDFPVPPPLDINALAARLRPLLEAPGSFPLNLTALIPSSSGGSSADISVTHAVRLAVYTPPTVPIGTTLFETDRAITYICYDNSGTLVWKYSGGVMSGATLANRPTDLGINDIGFIFLDLNLITQYEWSGSAWFTSGGLYQSILNGATTALTTVFIIQHLTTGAAGGAGMAVGNLAQLSDDTAATVDASQLVTETTVAAAATYTSKWTVQLRSAGAALADWFRVRVTDIAFNVGGFFGIFTHANTADRTYTLPNETGAITYKTVAALTASAIVLGDGTAKVKVLGSLGTTTTVLHGNAAGDPTFAAVSLTADVSGVLPVANGGTGVDNSTQTYTPTHTALTNLDATTPRLTSYYRVGNVVTLAGGFSADPTAAGACSFEMSVPIASDFANTFEAGGTSALVVGAEPGGISAVVANDTLIVQWVAAGTADAAYTFNATYRVI